VDTIKAELEHVWSNSLMCWHFGHCCLWCCFLGRLYIWQQNA
jgi:hypothetical protein